MACDVDASTMEVAKTFWEKAGVSDRVEARLSKATDTLQELLDNGEAGTYDFIFIGESVAGARLPYL